MTEGSAQHPNPIAITSERKIGVDAFVDILERSGLAERRPVDDLERLKLMLAHANLILSAWEGDKLVGLARCLTDFGYVTYCSDLAVDRAYRGRGIGKALLLEAKARLHPSGSLYLRSAPKAVGFYDHVGPEIGLFPVDRFYAMMPKGRD